MAGKGKQQLCRHKNTRLQDRELQNPFFRLQFLISRPLGITALGFYIPFSFTPYKDQEDVAVLKTITVPSAADRCPVMFFQMVFSRFLRLRKIYCCPKPFLLIPALIYHIKRENMILSFRRI